MLTTSDSTSLLLQPHSFGAERQTAAPLHSADLLYSADYYAWTQKMAQILRSKAYEQISTDNLSNLIEEVEDMGNNVLNGLESYLENLLMHLLKYQFQPSRRSRSWLATIVNARLQMDKKMRKNPSLRARLPDLLADAYAIARRSASAETGLVQSRFPETCPYTLEQVMQDDWMPA
jgi:Domain of unknown function DUF29